MEFRLADLFSEKIIVGPNGVPDPPSLAQMTFTQCTSMSELKIDSGALGICVIFGTFLESHERHGQKVRVYCEKFNIGNFRGE